MRTATFTHDITIDRPAAEVWALVADYDNDPAWRAGVETMTPEPRGIVGVGTTTLEVLRFGGRTHRIPGEVVDVRPGRSFAWRASKAEGTRTVVPLGDGRCRVEMSMAVHLRGADRMLASLLVPLLRRRVESDLARLGELAEGRVTAAALAPELPAVAR